MASSLLTDGTWQMITRLARKAISVRVAVAYFGQGASRLLPLKTGSVLVVDLSKAAVRSGQTCPQEIIKLLRRGVEVHSCSNLHAKVFVFGRRALVGSANVSRNSEQGLVEAVVETTDPKVVRSCRAFVDSLRGEHIDLDYARRLSRIYRPPRFAKAGDSPTPRHPPFWAVPLETMEWEAQDKAIFKRSEPVAEKRLKDQDRFRLDSYLWTGAGFRRPLRVGELVLQVLKEAAGKTVIYPAARAILIRRYEAEGEKRMMVFLRAPRVRRKNLVDVKENIGEAGKLLRKLKNPRLIRSQKMVHDLLQLWPSLNEIE
jgi:hypothetical protein